MTVMSPTATTCAQFMDPTLCIRSASRTGIDRREQGESDADVSPVVPHFELCEETAVEGTLIIHVRGEIHLSTAPRFSRLLQESIDNGNTAIVLDLSGVEFIDSTGLSVLLNGLRRVSQLQGRMALVCANPTVLRLFEITSLNETFDIFADPAAACAHVRQPAGESSDGAP
jgi:anti-sigma B factor antagonist